MSVLVMYGRYGIQTVELFTSELTTQHSQRKQKYWGKNQLLANKIEDAKTDGGAIIS